MHCQRCGEPMEMLPDLYFHSGKSWYGCKKCNVVIEENYCSVSGGHMGTEPCFLNYEQYKERIVQKEFQKKK